MIPSSLPRLPARFRLLLGAALLAPAWLLGQNAPAAGSITIEPAVAIAPDGTKIDFELGTLYVPENRANPNSRIIGVGFARFRATGTTGAPPTFHLPGGPGNSYLRSMNLTAKPEARKINARQANDLRLYRAVSDVIYLDQRGATDRGEVLTYAYEKKAQPLDQPGSLKGETEALVALAKAAIADGQAKGHDLAGYTVWSCVDDLNDLRRALGYDRVTLIGQSFGGQWTFATLRRHPGIVARAVISGVEPLDLSYDMPSHVYESMRRQWLAAEKDPKFAPHVPPGGIAGAVREIIARLEKAPVQVKVPAGKNTPEATVTLGRDDFRPEMPGQILEIYHGHYETWARQVLHQRQARKAKFETLGYLIDTSIAVTPERRQLLRDDPGVAVLGEWNYDDYMATEAIWPTQDIGDEFRTEVQCDIPVLFVQGDWDTSTPKENLVQVLPFFTRSRALLVHNGLHGAYAKVRETLPEATAAIMEFIKDGNTAKLPSRVTVPITPWPAPRLGEKKAE